VNVPVLSTLPQTFDSNKENTHAVWKKALKLSVYKIRTINIIVQSVNLLTDKEHALNEYAH